MIEMKEMRYAFKAGNDGFIATAMSKKQAEARLAEYLKKYHDTNYRDVKSQWKLTKVSKVLYVTMHGHRYKL